MKTYLQLSAELHVQAESLTLNIDRVERNVTLCMQLHHLLKKTKEK